MKELALLIIDDENGPPHAIRKALQNIGVAFTHNLVQPDRDRLDEKLMGMEGLDARSLGAYDVALVDLELKGAHSKPAMPISYYPRDLGGGSEILPHIREQAPWLPVIGYSRLFDFDIPSFLSVVGGFRFDGLIQRTMFDGAKLHREMWNLLLDSAIAARMRAVLGEEFSAESAGRCMIRATKALRRELDSLEGDWEGLLQRCFYFADDLSVELLTPGYSGAVVLKVVATTRLKEGAQKGSWVVKMSVRRADMWMECRAHRHFLQAGLPLARSVPLLWGGVVTHGRLGAVVYQLASNSTDARTALKTWGADKVEPRIAAVLRELHGDPAKQVAPLGSLLQGVVASASRVDRAASELTEWELGVLWARFRAETSAGVLEKTVNVSAGMVHRDLHLRNVLLGERDVLIDFALAQAGPIVYDLARVATDFLLVEVGDETRPLALSLEDETVSELVTKLGGALTESEHDQVVFELCLQLCFAQAFTYEDISDAQRKWIAQSLGRSGAPSVLKGAFP